MRTTAIAVLSPPDLEATVAPQLADAPHLLLVDPVTREWVRVSNWLRGPQGETKIVVARFLAERDVETVICGDYGLRARHALEAAGVLPYRCPADISAREALDRLGKGRLRIQRPERAAPGPAGIYGWLTRLR